MKFRSITLLFCFSAALFITTIAEENRVKNFKIINDKAPDNSSLKSIVDSVTKGLETNDQKAIAIYNYMMFITYHRKYPREKGGVATLKVFNTYGWSLCGGLHTMESALWRELGWKWRYLGWKGHTTTEAFYDNKWHYLDVFLKFYTWKKDPNAKGGKVIASQQDILESPSLALTDIVHNKARGVSYFRDNQFKLINDEPNWMAPALLVCGDTAKGVVQGVKTKKNRGSPTSWAGINFDTGDYKSDVNLNSGMKLNLMWSKIEGAHWWFPSRKEVPQHSCNDKDYRNSPSLGPLLEPYRSVFKGKGRSYANGILSFSPIINSSLLKSVFKHENVIVNSGVLKPINADEPAFITIRFDSPYVMSKAKGTIDNVTEAEISTNNGKSFQKIMLNDFSKNIGGKYNCLLKIPVTKEVKNISIEIITQINRCSLPFLSPGENNLTVSKDASSKLGKNKMVVTYTFQIGSRRKTFDQFIESGHEVAKAHFAAWSKQKYFVRKILSESDFKNNSYQFKINIGTPKDKQPVYPRMIALTREVLSPDQKPSPLASEFKEYTLPENYELKSLPNPFHVGTQLPPIEKPKPFDKSNQKVEFSHAVSKDGKVADNHYVKEKKGENWAILLRADVSKIKSSKAVKSVVLNLPVIKGRSKAKVKIIAVILKAPFEKSKPYDFANFNSKFSHCILPPQNSGDYSPAKNFKIDITKLVKTWRSNNTSGTIYIAVSTKQDRSVDEGYTVRADFDKDATFSLDLEIFKPE
ncbi:MAG: hypothetical protein COA79_14045 [Planctomycetota bacterium]|nr:MAG: hypothetical protein COA79_14045 [Planctomycetota bacterium]